MPALVRAAQYARMSLERQQYSLDNRKVAIARYVAQLGFEIVRTYEDAARSGPHHGLRQATVQRPRELLAGVVATGADDCTVVHGVEHHLFIARHHPGHGCWYLAKMKLGFAGPALVLWIDKGEQSPRAYYRLLQMDPRLLLHANDARIAGMAVASSSLAELARRRLVEGEGPEVWGTASDDANRQPEHAVVRQHSMRASPSSLTPSRMCRSPSRM